MSFFGNSNITSFSSNLSTPQKIYTNKIFKNNNQKTKELFTSINMNKKSNNLFTTTDNKFSNYGIFSFPKSESNNKILNNNISDRIIFGNSKNNQNIFTNNNYICKKSNIYNDYTIGTIFRGRNMNSKKNNINFMSITSLPEFSHGSNEEFRLADLERKKTGNIIYFKINNTSLSNNNIGRNSNLHKNNLFNNNILCENSRNNIFNKKLESNLFNFKSNNKNNNTLFSSNIENNNQKKNILFGKKNHLNSSFPLKESNIKNNYNNIGNSFLGNKFLNGIFIQKNNNYNINNSELKSKKDFNIPFDDLEMIKLLSQNGLSQEIKEAIQKEKTVKEFLEDLYKEYKDSENINENNSEISKINSFTSDLFDSHLSNNSNGNTSLQKKGNSNYENGDFDNINKIELNNHFNEANYYNMEIENDFNYDKLASKLNEIYGENKKIKLSNENGIEIQKYINNNKLNLSPNKQIIYTNNGEKNDNEYFFNKTFSNGFPKYDSLLNNTLSNNNNNKKNSKDNNNNNNNFIGRDESLYQKNLVDFNKICISNVNFKEDENKEHNENQIFLINNNSDNYDLNKKIKRSRIDLIIKYNLIDEENKNNDENLLFYNIVLKNINQMIKIRDLKEEIKKKVNNEIKNKHIYNYEITKIVLLTPLEFLSDNKILMEYKLDSYDYSIQSFIFYKKTNIKINLNENKELAPIELVPKLSKPGYNCNPTIYELCRKTCKELEKIINFKIFNEFGEVEFKEPVNLLGINLDKEVTISKNMIETGEKLNYWSIFKLYNFTFEEKEIDAYIKIIEKFGGKFISYKNNELIWEYKEKK